MKKKLLPVLLLAIILLVSCVLNQTTPNLTEYSISDSSEEPDHTTAATNLTQKTKTLTVGNLNLQYNDDYTIMEQSSDYADLTGVEDTKIFVMHDYSTITIEQLFESLIPDEIEYEIIEDNQTEINGVIWDFISFAAKKRNDMYLNTLLVTHHEDGSTYVFYYIIQGALYDSLSDDLLAILTSLELDTTVASPQIEENILAASKLLFEDHYDSLKEFDIDDTQKLAMILTAQYLDMQNRIDINAIAALNPQINENLKLYHDEFIAQMLTTHDFELLATDSANIEEGVLTFNAAYSFLNDSSMQLGMNKSVLYNKFNYEWSELTGNWLLTGSINADTESSEKPDRLLNIYSMQDESKALFGVENLMELFNFTGKSFRDEFSELYDLY